MHPIFKIISLFFISFSATAKRKINDYDYDHLSVRRNLHNVDCISTSPKPDYLNAINMTHPTKGAMLLYYNIVKIKGKWAIDGLVEYGGHGWVSWGVSETGHMDNGVSIIGFMNEPNGKNNPRKYHMFGPDDTFTVDNMVLAADGIMDGWVDYTSHETILYFTKRLIQGEDYPIHKDGINYFILAGGDGSDFTYHPVRRHVDVDLTKACW